MKVLIIDQYSSLLFEALRAQEDGHDVKVWMPFNHYKKPQSVGDGMITKVREWRAYMKWADLIITGGNDVVMRELKPFFTQGYPIFGCNPQAAELELDRGLGQEVCQEYGIDTLPYEMFNSYEDAAKYVRKTMGTYVCKPWGGTEDKSLSYVSGSPEDMIWKLGKWREGGKLKGQIILQKRIDGVEMAVGGWFGRNGWSQYFCENFEEKKFMNEGLGCNTGEQGTILRYVTDSKLFEQCLEPITGYLHRIGYVGYVDQNCMVDGKGKAWPLEYTMRFGYPLCAIQDALHQGDSVEWKYDAVCGRDTLKVSNDIAVGVVFSHGDYPASSEGCPENEGFPLYGMTTAMESKVKLWHVKMGVAPANIGNAIKDIPTLCTAGNKIAVVTGTGATVQEASEKAYNVCWKLKPPTNRMFRTDIGERLKKHLPELQKWGFAKGMKY